MTPDEFHTDLRRYAAVAFLVGIGVILGLTYVYMTR